MALTAKQVDNLKPRESEFLLADQNGLYLRVRTSGAKSWLFKFRYQGKADKLTLGSYPLMSLKQARRKATELASALENGTGPREFIEEQVREAQKRNYTVQALWDEFDDVRISKRKRPEQARYIAERYILPVIGKRPTNTLKKADVLAVFTPLKAIPSTAGGVFSLLKMLLEFGVNRGEVNADCIYGLKAKDVGGHGGVPRDRVLSLQEIQQLLCILDSWQGSPSYRHCILMMLASGQRISTILSARWSEFDFDNRVWTIPPSSEERYTKSKKARRLPLSDRMLAILEAQRAHVPLNYQCIFPKRNEDKPPVNTSINSSINQMLKRQKSMESDQLNNIHPHDLRRTFYTRMLELRQPKDIVERVVGHAINGIEAHYLHHDFFQEQHAALQFWGEQLDALELSIQEADKHLEASGKGVIEYQTL